MRILVSFVAGVIFATGLIISGMTNPNIVIGFLDFFGNWDMRLLFVMGGAVTVNFLFFRIFLKRQKPFFNKDFCLPTKKDIDWRLVIGSALFGVGWGTMGVCPGPGIVNLVTGKSFFVIFVFSMFIGMMIFKFTLGKKE